MNSRSFIIALLLIGCLVCILGLLVYETRPKADTNRDAELIQGTWVLVELNQSAHAATEEEKEFLKKGGYKITITGEKMIHSPDNSEGRYRLDPTKMPRLLEFLEGDKVIVKGIYELDGDDLKFCLGRKPEHGEEPQLPINYDLKNAVPGTFPSLWILKRETAHSAREK